MTDNERNVIEAAKNLVKVKGRYHSQQAYDKLTSAVNQLQSPKQTESLQLLQETLLVEDICDAYESGIGHGLKKDGLRNGSEYFDTRELAKAYTIGYELGEERSKEK